MKCWFFSDFDLWQHKKAKALVYNMSVWSRESPLTGFEDALYEINIQLWYPLCLKHHFIQQLTFGKLLAIQKIHLQNHHILWKNELMNGHKYIGCHPKDRKCHNYHCRFVLIIPPATKSKGGILDSPCSSVRLSVCPSVCLSVRPSVRPWVGVRMITLILFSGFKFFLHISLGSRSCMGLNISVLPH